MGKKRINITLDPHIHELGKKLGKMENRDFSNYLETLILKDQKEKERTFLNKKGTRLSPAKERIKYLLDHMHTEATLEDCIDQLKDYWNKDIPSA